MSRGAARETTTVGRIRAGGAGCGGFLLLLFVVLLLAELPVFLKVLGLVVGTAAAFVSGGIIHGAVQRAGGWRALFQRTAKALRRPYRNSSD